MKKLLLSGFALVSTLILFSCNGNAKVEKTTTASGDATAPVISAAQGGVVYVRIDSLLNNYNMYKDLQATYDAEVKKADANLRAKGIAIQKDMNSLQEKYSKGLMTSSQAEEEQNRLQRRGQTYDQEREKTANDLAEKQNVMLNQINEAIISYLEKYNADKKYSLILNANTRSINSPVIIGNSGIDITDEVLAGLNAEYVSSKK